jgi:hypothetical protein
MSKPIAPEVYSRFLEHLREVPNVSHAARAAGITQYLVYKHRKADPVFSAAWDDALDEAIQRAEKVVHDRAFKGVPEPIVHQGQIQYEHERDAHGRVIFDVVETPGVNGGPPTFDRVPRLKLDIAGNPIPLVVYKPSDQLAQFLLRAHRPERYRERSEIAHTGSVAIQVVTGVPAPGEDLV